MSLLKNGALMDMKKDGLITDWSMKVGFFLLIPKLLISL